MNKNALKTFAIWAREQLMEAVKLKAYEYGVDENGYGEEKATVLNGRALSNAEAGQRAELITQIKRKGFHQVVEEVAYTWFNRFIALRYMEVNGYLPTRIRVFSDESGAFNPEILKQATNIELEGLDKNTIYNFIDKQDNEGLFKYLVIAQCNTLNRNLPGMFEKINNYTELLFPNKLLADGSVAERMVSTIPEEDWKDQVQIIGWLYQYYNSAPKDKVFADLKKNIKVSKEAIPAATQLFTPDWIVRYMVENSLGRVFSEQLSVNSGQKAADSEEERIAAQKKFAEKNGWKYFLPDAPQSAEVRAQLSSLSTDHSSLPTAHSSLPTAHSPLTAVKLLDPCMGSGHILVYAFDVFMQIYLSQGWNERDAAKSIVENNLYGIDIDERAYQLAYFAVMMKARSYNRRILNQNIKCNLCAIVESNDFNENYLELFGTLKNTAKKVVDEFKDAKEYGSILNVKTELADLYALREKLEEIKEAVYDNFFDNARRSGLITDFEPILKEAIALAQKYDVVVTNPPYMGAGNMNANLNQFIKDEYADYKSDFFSAFIVRATQMATKDGYCGFFTPYVWMFIQSYEKLRHLLCEKKTIETLIQFEYSAFEEATVPVCTFVFRNSHISKKGCYLRLTDFRGGMEIQRQKTLEAIANHDCGYYYEANADQFSQIPGSPVAYWVSESTIKAYDCGQSIGEIAFPKTGMTTGDNNRFLRFWYEIEWTKVSVNSKSSEEAQESQRKWFPYCKGGGFRRWYGYNEYLVNWENDGYEIKNNIKDNGLKAASVRSENMYFKPLITWSAVTSGKFSCRYCFGGSLFDSGGSSISVTKNRGYLLALLNAKIGQHFLNISNATINYQPNDIASIPVVFNYIDDVESKADSNITLSRFDWDSFETSWDFKKNPLV